MTPQRLMIMSVLRHEPGHLTAHEILDRVKDRFPFVDISTVYRTVATLRDLRLVAEVDIGGGDRSYEWLREPHHHLVCRVCGEEAPLPREHLGALAGDLRRETGFEIDVDHISLTGVCAGCLNRTRKNEGGRSRPSKQHAHS